MGRNSRKNSRGQTPSQPKITVQKKPSPTKVSPIVKLEKQSTIPESIPIISTPTDNSLRRNFIGKQVLGFLTAVIAIVGLVATSFQLAGVITMEIAHSLIFFAALVALAYISIFVFTSDSLKYLSIIRKVIIIFFGLVVVIPSFYFVDLWMVNKRAEIDIKAEAERFTAQTIPLITSITQKTPEDQSARNELYTNSANESHDPKSDEIILPNPIPNINAKPKTGESQSSKSDETVLPVQTPNVEVKPNTSELSSSNYVGISGTGVTANVKVVQVNSFSGGATYLGIENTSQSGTITNIGFIVKARRTPTWGGKTEDDNGITGPGVYRLTQEHWEIKTRDFKALSTFGLVTGELVGDAVARTFQDGFIGSGIPPGKTTWFALTGFGEPALLRGLAIRFQAIGEGNRADIAMFRRLDVLFPSATEPSEYQIQRTDENR